MPQSPELAGGAGITFEDLVSARFLAALLCEGSAPGMESAIVHQVALQQRDFGEPLDDIVVDFIGHDSHESRLSLQVKRSLTLSKAPSNSDFRDIIRDSLKTLQKPGFRDRIDRFGAAAGSIASGSFRTLTTLCEIARASATIEHFAARFAAGGNASAELTEMRDTIDVLLSDSLGSPCPSALLHRFLSHFVLIQFDYLHEGGVDNAAGADSVRPALPDANASQASQLWGLLCRIARNGAGRSQQFLRTSLVGLVSKEFRLRGAPSFRHDLAELERLARAWILDIEDDVSGTRLARPRLADQLGAHLSEKRFIQIRGLPGCGKSVLLRKRVEADLGHGPLLFLKADRLEGRSWTTFATAIGLTSRNLREFLVELGTVGTPVVYIDGIDRVEKQHQPVIADIVRTIVRESDLQNWRIVASLRDAGTEPLRTWLPDFFPAGGVGTVDVGPLDDEEAGALAEAQPNLRRLLFGSAAVREIVRRPFFAKILSQDRSIENDDESFAPQSEVDLIEKWWARGGFNATGSSLLRRQRAIVELAATRVRELSRPIGYAGLTPSTIDAIDELTADGIVQPVRAGHSIRFAHDIFFEWALFHQLIDSGTAWLEIIKAAGEPPVIGRVVELLGQAEFIGGDTWFTTLSEIDASGMRSQWVRAWLLGPLSAPSFDQNRAQFFESTSKDNFRFLRRALVWFQAEKTIPNPAVLDGRIGDPAQPRDEIIRLADLMCWPSDLEAWRRLLQLVLDQIDAIPVQLIPDIVELFDVWQNAFSRTRNAISARLLTYAARWLNEIEEKRYSRHWQREEASSPWSRLESDLKSLEQSLRMLLLRSARIVPNLTTEYLLQLKNNENRLDQVFSEVIGFAPILVHTHAAEIVDLSLLHFRDELPEARQKREEEEAAQAAARRQAALAKPADQRTREDEFAGMGLMSILGRTFSYSDWEELGLERDRSDYFPASPLREPFHSLFAVAPAEALRLTKELTNHAVTAWRQLHRLDPERRATPLPIEMRFPWGPQTFWGTRREYLWYRGLWAPQPLASAYLALENWAFGQLEAGRSADELIQQIVEGNDSIAILGTAVSLALQSLTVSEVTLPLIANQRLWRADLERLTQEGSIASSSLIGFYRGSGDRAHARAVDTLNKRPVRKTWLRELVPYFVLSSNEVLADCARTRIAGFENELPFEYEEQRADDGLKATLNDDAKFNAEFAKIENYRAAQDPSDADTKLIVVENPRAAEPQTVDKLAKARENMQESLLWNWAIESLSGTLSQNVSIKSAIAFVKRVDDRRLFKAIGNGDSFQISTRRGAIAGVAAVVLKHRQFCDAADLKWARSVVNRAAETPEQKETLWSSGSIIPWHPCIFAARGLAAEVRAGDSRAETRKQLLRLVAHPLECVTLAALEEVAALWDIEPRLCWCALWLALALCQFETNHLEAGARTFDPAFIARARSERTSEAIAHFSREECWPDLLPVPPAWAPAQPSEAAEAASVGKSRSAIKWRQRRKSRQPHIVWDGGFVQKILQTVGYRNVLSHHQTAPRALAFLEDLLSWVIQKISPPWKEPGRREQSTHASELSSEVGRLFAILAGQIPTDETRRLFLNRAFALEHEECFSLLQPFVQTYIRHSILEAPAVPDNATEILGLCIDRMLQDPAFKVGSYRAGELHGWHLPQLTQSLMFASVDYDVDAIRFANGDWSEIETILPAIDRLMTAAGWSSSIMNDFLRFCERARDDYPAERFADQVLAALSGGRDNLRGWRGQLLPARIAGLVQHFAFREAPMKLELGQKLLRILDILIDMGDRRSAALQISDSFREIKAA